ncbi:nuclear transport factor 2 family protein [Pendulispora albinea]|uniref:Nuclear transport factor 2 family protein n=1 Tax=Pendulispora albinea TaxID=2741071 RepID=A0ABZ2LM16_9BACT
MSQSIQDLVQRYLDGWNETDPARRRALIEDTYTKDCTYTDPLASVSTPAGIDGFIGAVQKQYPGIVFTLSGAVDAHHNQARFTWHAGAPGAEPAVIGFDVALFEDGRIRHVYGFLDKAPPQ